MFINFLIKIKNILLEWIFYKLYTNLIQIDKKFYIIWYFHNFKWYAIKIPRKRGPVKKWQIFNNGINITQDITPYMGPNNDFYEMKISPLNLNYNNLEFRHNDTIKIFVNDENIEL